MSHDSKRKKTPLNIFNKDVKQQVISLVHFLKKQDFFDTSEI